MTTLYLSEQNAKVRREQNRLVVELEGQRLAEIHDFKVERVVVCGNVQMTTQVMTFLLERSIDTVFLSTHGKLKGRLTPLESKNVHLRTRQYERAKERPFTQAFAAAITKGKITNGIKVLARHQRNHPECSLNPTIKQMEALAERIQPSLALDSLRGFEGQAAALYFTGFARTLRRDFSFEKRTRRPPTDPINSLLSFGYALLHNEAIAALSVVGCDPYVGFYHSNRYGRCSLALDVMEEMRPLVADRLALYMSNLGIITWDDFVAGEEGGLLLTDLGRKKFFREYERLITKEFVAQPNGATTTLRRALHQQVQLLQRTILRGSTYQPFHGWH